MENVTGPEASTTEQRETLEAGLRTIARMIARAQLRRARVTDKPLRRFVGRIAAIAVPSPPTMLTGAGVT